MDFATDLHDFSQKITKILADFLQQQSAEALAIDPLVSQSIDMLSDFSLRGGKTIRPYLSHLAYQLAHGKDHDGLLLACASIELHHKHILILDDIADRDETRYGGPTLEYAYRKKLQQFQGVEHMSRSFAMMDGVLLGALSRELLLSSGFSPERILSVIHLCNTVMFRDTLAGWQIHGMQAQQPIENTTPKEFIKGLQLVTASYTFEGPLKIGLTLAGNTDLSLTKALTTYAQTVGTAFQIYDDILGLFGDPAKTGKPVGNDVREGKKTLLLQYAYQAATVDEKKFLTDVIGRDHTQTELETVQNLVKKTGALSQSQELASHMVEDGIRAIAQYQNTIQGDLLTQLARYIIAREK